MKRLILAVALLATGPALAADANPDTLRLPTQLVSALAGYLKRQPYEDVATLMQALQACVSVQVSQGGAAADHGQCPAVSATMQPPAPPAASTKQ